MKKLILLFCIISWSYYTNAQCEGTLPVSEDFSNTYLINSCWTKIDADGDGLGWTVSSMDDIGNKGLKSRSFGRTPDNWIISNPIDLPPTGIDMLTWKVRATYWQYDEEYYSVYVSTNNQISSFTSSPVTFSENLGGSDASGVFANRSLNISSLAGKTVYVAFRHHNVTDQLEIDIDDFAVTSTSGNGCNDSDNDGVCDSNDLCPNTPANTIVDSTGCEALSNCNENTANFSLNPITHSGPGAKTTTISLPSNSQDISFTISDLDEKTKGKESDKYIERVIVTYKNSSGATKTNGTYRGDQVSTATINIPGVVLSITLSLDDAYDGSAGSLSVNLSSVTYCGSATPCLDSDGDGICDEDDLCPGTPANTAVNLTGCPITGDCQESTISFNGGSLSGANSASLNLTNGQNASFTISGIGEKTKGKPDNQYVEHVEVTYVDGSGVSKTYGSYSGTSVSSTSINISGVVSSITVSLSDELNGSDSSNMNISLSDVTYCISSPGSSIPTNSSKESSDFQNEVLNVYPNPTSGTLYIKKEKLSDTNINVSIFDLAGINRLNYKLSNQGQVNEVNVNGLESGIYLMRMIDSNGKLLKTERIIVK